MRAMPDSEPSCACALYPPRRKAEAVLREMVEEKPVRDPFGTLPEGSAWLQGARAEQSRQQRRARAALEGGSNG